MKKHELLYLLENMINLDLKNEVSIKGKTIIIKAETKDIKLNIEKI